MFNTLPKYHMQNHPGRDGTNKLLENVHLFQHQVLKSYNKTRVTEAKTSELKILCAEDTSNSHVQ